MWYLKVSNLRLKITNSQSSELLPLWEKCENDKQFKGI